MLLASMFEIELFLLLRNYPIEKRLFYSTYTISSVVILGKFVCFIGFFQIRILYFLFLLKTKQEAYLVSCLLTMGFRLKVLRM